MQTVPIIPIVDLFEVMLPGLFGALWVMTVLVTPRVIEIGRDKATRQSDTVTRKRV